MANFIYILQEDSSKTTANVAPILEALKALGHSARVIGAKLDAINEKPTTVTDNAPTTTVLEEEIQNPPK